MKRYERVKIILEESVEGTEIGVHGNFWRDLTLEEFKEEVVFGKKLVEAGNAEESNLIKALEGRAPFGADIGTPGANTNRMPSGFPPVSPEKIEVIRKWIDDGCPDEEETPGIEDDADSTPADDDSSDNKIPDLMGVPAAEHDLGWLTEALHAAVKLELSTIPPYLCALWSIDLTQPHAEYPVDSIKTIVIDEMRHLGLVCNMLTTLGITPKLNTPDAVPTYPGPLPGGVNPQLTVALGKLSKSQLETFLEIEKPDHDPIMPESVGEEFDTIGLFYDAILAAFRKLPADAYKNERQITRGGLRRITNLADVEFAINDIIKKQGEGTEQSPEDEPGVDETDLAHYYRFRELLWERRFVKNEAGQWINGEAIPFPTVYDMADIPAGGYLESRDFDLKYTELLDSLHKTWELGSNPEMGTALGLMFELQDLAQTLMQTPLDPEHPEKGCFGPSFLLIKEKNKSPEDNAAKIKSLKIHPSIGVARIGNHPTEFYIGPEFPNGYIKPDEIGGFKAADAADGETLKIKRQGARFRVFAYYDDGQVRELNSDDAEITWSVKIANTKARGRGFYGINVPEDAPRNNFVQGDADRKSLGLEPGEISISGNEQSEAFEKVKFKVKDIDGTILESGDISLGECQTDEKGRLVVLGGFGNSGAVKNHPITVYDDNDYWYDDIADGYVKARVKLKETGEELNAADSWVLCVPPRYVPELRTIVTLYDTLFNKHWNEGRIQADPQPKFYRDIYPILQSAANVPHLHEMDAHFSIQGLLRPNSTLTTRKRLYDKLRKSDGAGGPGANMPKMFGDGYGSATLTRLILTSYQLLILSKWKDGNVEIDDISNSLPATEITPAGLDRAALENCIGGAFFPGIEASWFLRDKYQFIEPFRLDTSQIKPGDVTKQMALPWQADFLACAKEDRNDGIIAWWVFARPDDVVLDGEEEMHPWTPPGEFRGFPLGYQDMVEKWMKLGFVVEKDGRYVEVQRQIPTE